MEQTPQENTSPVRRIRRKKSKWQIFKEAYMPVLILGLALILVIVFISGSISRANKNKPTEPSDNTSIQTEDPKLQEATSLAAEAKLCAAGYDYDRALAILDTFSGDIAAYDNLSSLKTQLENAKAALVPFTDVASVPHLSFANLIADIAMTKNDTAKGSSYLGTYATVDEFKAILEDLYKNNYVLVSLHDLYTTTIDTEGKEVYGTGTLYLPAGKKPLVLSQVHVNYYTSMIASGFGSKLVLETNGNISCQMLHADATTSNGMYDFVPVLDAFIEEHPDFSYRGARATLALTGYQGVLGYRTQASAANESDYETQKKLAKSLADELKKRGYGFACYSYNGGNYSTMSAGDIREDLRKWATEVTPILGETDLFFLSMGIDIADTDEIYTGDKFQAMKDAGFDVFVGRDSSVSSWFQQGKNYYRQSRRWVTGNNLADSPEYFTDLFDAAAVRDTKR